MNSKDLRNIASVYEAVYGGGKKEEKKDTRLVVTAADKKANTKAYQNYKAGNKAYKAADHLGEGKAESPEAEEAKDKKDDDLAGAPNAKGKKKVKRWWDDDGDGIGYEKGEVKKEQNELVSKEVKDLQKAAKTGKGKYAAKADKLAEDKDTPDQVAAVIDMYRSKKGTGEAVKDTEEGKKKAAKKERDYAAFEREKMKQDDPDWKHKKGSTTESVDAEYIETVQKVKAAETEEDIKRWSALEESGNFTAEELEALKEADRLGKLEESEKLAQKAYDRAQKLGAKRRSSSNPRGIGKSERAGYNLAQSQRSRNTDAATQGGPQTGGGPKSFGYAKNKSNPVKSKSIGDTGATGHYKKRDEKVTSKSGKTTRYKLKFRDRMDHHVSKRQELKDPKKNPKHTANK